MSSRAIYLKRFDGPYRASGINYSCAAWEARVEADTDNFVGVNTLLHQCDGTYVVVHDYDDSVSGPFETHEEASRMLEVLDRMSGPRRPLLP